MSDLGARIDRHYGYPGLAGRIREALEADGKSFERLTREDLAPLDEFHVGGRAATLDLARWAGLGEVSGAQPGGAPLDVVDLGCGLGGPARTLAAEHGCRVTGLDRTAIYCRLAAQLSRRALPEAPVHFLQADARAVPLAAGCCDLVWSQHLTMNIPDKAALAREIARLLRPGGRLVLYEILAAGERSDQATPIFPVPWADTPELSHLDTATELRGALVDAGPHGAHLEELAWEDRSAFALDWFAERLAEAEAAQSGAAPALPQARLPLLFGAEGARKFRNVARNLREERITVARGLYRRPA